MMQEALDMGDEAHNRNNALASILSFELVAGKYVRLLFLLFLM